MKNELKALKQNQTWKLTDFPIGKKPIGCKWVFKVKYFPNETFERYKTRLVAKEFNQLLGLDFTDSFSLVVKLVTVRSLLAIAAARD